jgi:hypothetical protein
VLEIGAGDPRFVRIDATKPLDAVGAEVEARIDALLAERRSAVRPSRQAAPRR